MSNEALKRGVDPYVDADTAKATLEDLNSASYPAIKEGVNPYGDATATRLALEALSGTPEPTVHRGKDPYGDADYVKARIAELQGLPENTEEPEISGDEVQGATLTVDPGEWTNDPTFEYQWQRSADAGETWANIAGATAATRVLAAGDVGKILRAAVTARNSFGPVTAYTDPTGTITAD